jgi:hypothetical protein
MSTIAIVEAIGAMLAGPLLSQMFQWGMDLGSAWLGLPFLASVVVFAFVTALTFVISVKDRDIGYIHVKSDDEEDVGNELGRSSALDDESAPRHVI